MGKRKMRLPSFEVVISQMIKNVSRYSNYTYPNLEVKLLSDFNIENSSKSQELKDEIYWVFKYLKIIQFIYVNPEELIYLSYKGTKFLIDHPFNPDELDKIECTIDIKDYFNSFTLELDPIIVSYRQLMTLAPPDKVKKTISSFYCSLDDDIQRFVRRSLGLFDEKSICRVYLILDRKNSDSENFFILGFYALALKILEVDPSTLSSKQREDMNLRDGEKLIPSYFIAQLGKNDIFKYNFEGKDLLNESINIIYKCVEMLGGTVVWLEANKNAAPVIQFYQKNGFVEVQSELQADGIKRIQMFKFLKA